MKNLLSRITGEPLRAAGILIISTLIVYARPLFGGVVIIGNWTIFDQYPRLAFLSRALAGGESVLWSGNYLGGFPIYLGVWGEHISPIALFIFSRINFIDASHIFMVTNALLGGLAMYWLARLLSISSRGSLLAALIYMFSKWNLSYGQMLFWSNLMPILPLLFISALKIHKKQYSYFILGAAAAGLGWMTVMPDVILYVTIAVFLFSAYLSYAAKETTSRAKRYLPALLTALFLFAGITFALPKLIHGLVFVAETTRASGVQEAQGFLASADSHGYIGPNSIIDTVYPFFRLPYANFIPFFGGYDRLTFLYIGTVPLMLLLFFALGARPRLREHPEYLYFTALFVVTFLMLIKYIPLFYLVHKLPIFRLFGGTGKYAFLMYFALPILVALGYEHAEKISSLRPSKLFLRAASITTGFVIGTLGAINVIIYGYRNEVVAVGLSYFEKYLYRQASTGKPLEHYEKLIEKSLTAVQETISLANPKLFLSLLFLVLGVLLFDRYLKGMLTAHRFRKAAITLTLCNFVFLWFGFWDTIPRTVLETPPETVTYLKSVDQPEDPYRTFRFWSGLGYFVEQGLNDRDHTEKVSLEIAALSPNYALLHDIEFTAGHENLLSARQARLMAYIGSERAPGNHLWITDGSIPLQEKLARFAGEENRRLLGMMNTKYVISAQEFGKPWKKLTTTSVTSSRIPLHIYENPDALPRVYFARETLNMWEDSNKAFEQLLATKNFRTTTLIECNDSFCLNARGVAHPNDAVTITRSEGGLLKLSIRLSKPRWLVITNSQLPTWEATIDGTSARLPIATANYLFQAVFAPEGEYTLTLKYPGLAQQLRYSLSMLIARASGE